LGLSVNNKSKILLVIKSKENATEFIFTKIIDQGVISLNIPESKSTPYKKYTFRKTLEELNEISDSFQNIFLKVIAYV
jgi:hypothetical protein